MSVELFDQEDAYLRILRMLSTDWVAISGEDKMIELLENRVYTPNTNKNANFELAMYPGFILFLGKKTPELRKFMQLENEPEVWNSMFVINLTSYRGLGKFESKHFPPNMTTMEKNLFLEEFVKEIVYGRPEEAIDKEEDK